MASPDPNSNRALYPLWGNLESAVREGSNRWEQTFGSQRAVFDHLFKSEEAKRDFLAGMHGFGLLSSPLVAAASDLSRFRRLVDLGGASGHLAMEICRRYPGLRASVFDLPGVTEVAHEYIHRSGMAERIGVIAGDFFQDALPEGDLFSVGRILHDWSEDKIRRLLSKIYERLPAGGALLVAERLLDEDKTGPLNSLLQSLSMLVIVEGRERTLPGKRDQTPLEKSPSGGKIPVCAVGYRMSPANAGLSVVPSADLRFWSLRT